MNMIDQKELPEDDIHTINSVKELREIVIQSDKQNNVLRDRLNSKIDQHAEKFIGESPVVFFGTANDSGHVDISPKGDAPGFVEVKDEKTLLFPERRGNTDARGLRNILENNRVSLLFVIPRMKDVLRITGTAIITQKPDLLKRMTSCGKPAQLCIKITVEECFFHCGRAFNRSHIWVPEKWPESEQDFMHEQYVQKHNCTAQEAEEIAKRKQAVLDQLGETNGAY